MPIPKASLSPPDLKHRVLTLLTKLSDRDTYTLAATELDSIARTLPPSSISPFLTYITFPLTTTTSIPSPVRKQTVRLLSILSTSHGNSLSPFLSKMLSQILLRRLKDSDSSVRSACISAVSTMSACITTPPFTLFLKPLSETILAEQDYNSQLGSALCLASAIESSPDPEPVLLLKLLPKFVKLLRSDSFKAKPALLSLVGTVVVGSTSGGNSISRKGLLESLIGCLIEFLSCDDWAARKAAAEAFVKLALVERDHLAEFKSSCLASFETKRFDKVKVVRDTMNQMMDTWKNVPDVSDEVSTSSQSKSSSSTDNGSDMRFSSCSMSSSTMSNESPLSSKNTIPKSKSPPPSDSSSATTDRKRSPLNCTEGKSTPPLFRKMDRKKPADWKIEISVPCVPAATVYCEDDFENRDGRRLESGEDGRSRRPNQETRDTFFNKNSGEKMHKLGQLRPGSTVVPFHAESSGSTITGSDNEELYGNFEESEDLFLIQKKLIQIEAQQSSLLDLLQIFIGSSQNGIRSLETRVDDLEMALDEISYDLAASTRNMPTTVSAPKTCGKLPGADFLSSKLWRKTEGKCTTSRFSSWEDTSSLSSLRHMDYQYGNTLPFNLDNRRAGHRNVGPEYIVNPLAEMYSGSRRSPRCT